MHHHKDELWTSALDIEDITQMRHHKDELWTSALVATCLGLAITVGVHRIDRIFDEIPATNTLFTPYIYTVLANP